MRSLTVERGTNLGLQITGVRGTNWANHVVSALYDNSGDVSAKGMRCF
jgi:hypothetical protein